MPNVLILCAHRPGRSPSQRYRFEQYLPILKEHGFNFTFSYLLNEKDDKLFYSPGNFLAKLFILFKSVLIRFKDIFRYGSFDIVFIQREATFFGTSFFEKRAFKSGAYVIFDFDDSIWLADTSPGNLKWEWVKKPGKFYTNLKYAHTVIAGNEYLAEKAKVINPNTIIIPTTIDTNFHSPMPQLRGKDAIVIGWSGSISTIKHFESLLPILIKLKNKYGEKIKFKIIGQGNYSNPQLKVESVAWSHSTEVKELNSMHIGIMPIPNNEWANGKCGLKGLAYMACGVATIMSEVGINKKIIKHGTNGFLAENDYEWFNLLCELIENTELREQLGNEGRRTVQKVYSVEANKQKYLEVLKHVKSIG